MIVVLGLLVAAAIGWVLARLDGRMVVPRRSPSAPGRLFAEARARVVRGSVR